MGYSSSESDFEITALEARDVLLVVGRKRCPSSELESVPELI